MVLRALTHVVWAYAGALYLKKHPDAPVKIAARSETTTSSVIPVRKGSTALLEAIDEALDALRDSGELSALSQRYFGMDVTQE